MTTQPYWNEPGLEGAWDFVWLGQDLLPGVATVTVQKNRSLDVTKSKGRDGAKVTDQGYDPATVTITVKLWTKEHWEAWQQVFKNIDPENVGASRAPIEIYHPEPNSKGVTHVYIESINGSVPNVKDRKTETLNCIQWVPETRDSNTSDQPAKRDNTTEDAAVEDAPDNSIF